MPKKSSKQLYHKLFLTYTTVIVCIVFALMVYFIFAMKAKILETNINYMKMMKEEAVSYLEECRDTARNINNDLYQDTQVMEDLFHYFNDSEESYQKYRLNTYMNSSTFIYLGFDGFAEQVLNSYPNILKISFFSYEKNELTNCYPGGTLSKEKGGEFFLKKLETGDLAKEGEFAFSKELRIQYLDNLKSIGCMIITFSGKKFEKIYAYYDKPELFIKNDSQTVLYHSFQDNLKEPLTKIDQDEKWTVFQNSYIEKGKTADYTVYAFLRKNQASAIPVSAFFTVLLIGAAAVILGEGLVSLHLKRLTKRLNYILEGMQKVTTGDLKVRLAVDINGDELDVISGNFNEMCEKLDRYIQKSYLAEIEQKNAEMEVLINQINPHFLYNTLESIRMKAILNGDREVGKMLYSMAVIYRSQLKENDVITLIQEIHYCKKYLELFEYRYDGKFTANVECAEELMNYPIIKFILQPVLENYFMHGIRPEQEGNEINVYAEKAENALLIHVIDNGNGMDESIMQEKNEELENNRYDTKKSIGLLNVNKRIKAVYGKGYGITLKKKDETQPELTGLHVIVKVGLGEETNEKGNDCRG